MKKLKVDSDDDGGGGRAQPRQSPQLPPPVDVSGDTTSLESHELRDTPDSRGSDRNMRPPLRLTKSMPAMKLGEHKDSVGDLLRASRAQSAAMMQEAEAQERPRRGRRGSHASSTRGPVVDAAEAAGKPSGNVYNVRHRHDVSQTPHKGLQLLALARPEVFGDVGPDGSMLRHLLHQRLEPSSRSSAGVAAVTGHLRDPAMNAKQRLCVCVPAWDMGVALTDMYVCVAGQ